MPHAAERARSTSVAAGACAHRASMLPIRNYFELSRAISRAVCNFRHLRRVRSRARCAETAASLQSSMDGDLLLWTWRRFAGSHIHRPSPESGPTLNSERPSQAVADLELLGAGSGRCGASSRERASGRHRAGCIGGCAACWWAPVLTGTYCNAQNR